MLLTVASVMIIASCFNPHRLHSLCHMLIVLVFKDRDRDWANAKADEHSRDHPSIFQPVSQTLEVFWVIYTVGIFCLT